MAYNVQGKSWLQLLVNWSSKDGCSFVVGQSEWLLSCQMLCNGDFELCTKKLVKLIPDYGILHSIN